MRREPTNESNDWLNEIGSDSGLRFVYMFSSVLILLLIFYEIINKSVLYYLVKWSLKVELKLVLVFLLFIISFIINKIIIIIIVY